MSAIVHEEYVDLVIDGHEDGIGSDAYRPSDTDGSYPVRRQELPTFRGGNKE